MKKELKEQAKKAKLEKKRLKEDRKIAKKNKKKLSKEKKIKIIKHEKSTSPSTSLQNAEFEQIKV